MKQFEIHQITHLPPKILALEKEAIGQGFRFITRLIDEWHSGTNRFDAPGECLMVACLNQQLIGVGGGPLIHMRRPIRQGYAGYMSQLHQEGSMLVTI